MATRSTLEFLRTETGSGLLLAFVAAFAILWANSPWAAEYAAFVGRAIPVRIGPFAETLTLAAWVKTALMPIFFLVMGLKIKQEIVRGELSNPRRLALPVLAALGGVLAPAAIFLAVNAGEDGVALAWPAAVPTDAAIALALVAIAAPRLPQPLRVFLLTVAIIQDLISVAMIAVVFAETLRPAMLGGALATFLVLAAMARWRAAPYAFWTAGFLLLWGFVVKSGLDPSVAGVLAAAVVPLQPKRPGGPGVLDQLLAALHPYVAFLVLPLFILTAAGFSVRDLPADTPTAPVALGLGLALVLGKQLGVFGAAALAIGLKWARRPMGAKWLDLYGVAVLCGVGFTLSLYIGELAFDPGDALSQAKVRIGVVAGSLASALLGMAALAVSDRRRPPDD
ncbi:Na+/H+ antiporter [Phenylobacterium zucineum HLK1]|uniref:Na(+)/H(+) antiporter NhaA n=1 Tax=Phenylobacterium zucineum (strain HLK1) TaxID=450851 RepID=B4R8D5_PHEZH|nr:Na+/H+ antiporter NhaA [Phenylobacterium zucineum]ACG79253.1 Na+/H+ antiporter [Phenylobacterium zucineum HLK1]